MAKEGELTAKQAKFCEEYMVDLNAMQAAIRAGYSKKTAKVIGCENLTKPNLAAKIAELKAGLSEKTGVDAEMITAEFKKIAFGKVSKTRTNKNKISSLENLGKHVGYYKEDNEQKGLTITDIMAIVAGRNG